MDNHTPEMVSPDVRRSAEAHSEATTYSLNNPYLTAEQKADVEAIYQFPLGVFSYSFALIALVRDGTLWTAYWQASVICVLSIVACIVFMRARWFVWTGTLFGGSVAMLLQLGLAVWAFIERRWGVGIFLGLQAIGLMAFFIPSLWLWPAFVGGGMNPKYLIAKRMFGVVFPFEHHLPQPNNAAE